MRADPGLLAENRNKYGGDCFDDIDELANTLSGRQSGPHSARNADSNLPPGDEIDENFIRTLGNPRNHYGSTD